MSELKIYLRQNSRCEGFAYCERLIEDEYATLNKPQYREGVSILKADARANVDYLLSQHRTWRKRTLRAANRGYWVRHIEPADYNDAILEINRSLTTRQGRAMDPSYTNRPPTTGRLGAVHCHVHHRRFYGVLHRRGLAGYISIIRCGELIHVSQLLGHGDYLDDGIMYLGMKEMLFDQWVNGPGYVFYNRHDSGTEGLRWFKERLGFEAKDVTWIR